VLKLGTARHHDLLLRGITSLDDVGCFALTELGFGALPAWGAATLPCWVWWGVGGWCGCVWGAGEQEEAPRNANVGMLCRACSQLACQPVVCAMQVGAATEHL